MVRASWFLTMGKIEVVKHVSFGASPYQAHHYYVDCSCLSKANKGESRHWHGFFHSIMKKAMMMILWACNSSSSIRAQGTVLLLADCGD